MGPGTKKCSRKDYVKYRLRVLKELHIAPPSQEKIDAMMDEKSMSEIQVDAIFLGCMDRRR